MRSYVVDASLVVKWFVPEVHSDAAIRFLDSDFHLLVPDLLYPEVGNTLCKKIRGGTLTEGEALQIIAALDRVPLDIQPSSQLLPAALEVAALLDRSVYDALYLSAALSRGCKMATADRRLHSVVSGSQFRGSIAWVEDAP